MRDAWYVFLIVAALVALFVIACIVWCLVAYNVTRDRKAEQFTGNSKLETVYVVVPLIVVILLFLLTLRVEIPVDAVAASNGSHQISATAFRWSWRFAYAGGRIVAYGRTGEPPTLYLPVDRPTEIVLLSNDVTHSFWVPAFLFKRDAIPGITNRFMIDPNRLGSYVGRCAQFCGLDHAMMSFQVQVVPDGSYDRFIASNGAVLP